MSEIAQTGPATGSTAGPASHTDSMAHEAYAFACMQCGHGWEQAYEIAHPVDANGELHVVYYADGERVPSPLTQPVCRNCGGNVVRIMRAGQVSMVSDAIAGLHQRRGPGRVQAAESAAGEGTGSTPEPAGRHHWHLSDLLRPFQHHHK
ncbi:hypothetical protein [Streptomyces sp. NPDC017993]|uniref:hypothetical protein n=1 Tax=Streptomyces sp. NPDC017993 TaxID=3365027 RepID=UPI003793CF19